MSQKSCADCFFLECTGALETSSLQLLLHKTDGAAFILNVKAERKMLRGEDILSPNSPDFFCPMKLINLCTLESGVSSATYVTDM
eukprot:gene13919-biopygen16721